MRLFTCVTNGNSHSVDGLWLNRTGVTVGEKAIENAFPENGDLVRDLSVFHHQGYRAKRFLTQELY